MSFCEKSILAKEERKFAFKVDFFSEEKKFGIFSYTREVITLGFRRTDGLNGTTLMITHTRLITIMSKPRMVDFGFCHFFGVNFSMFRMIIPKYVWQYHYLTVTLYDSSTE